MNCSEWRAEFQRWTETVITGEQNDMVLPEKIAEHTSECAECSARLKSFLVLMKGTPLKRRPDPGLSGRVFSVIEESGRIKRHNPLRWLAVPLAASIIAALAVFLTFTLRGTEGQMVTIHLSLEAPYARSVSVVGDWNAWDPRANILHDPEGDGTWEIKLKLSSSRDYRYQFLIDGTYWIPDPDASLHVDDGFGGINSVLEI
ncbi:MAG: isoamylase early set domain-containing protein [Spirochaetales bacterium]|nr:isoamylase early set domain-containing protein [Spirochaetales bacterium]